MKSVCMAAGLVVLAGGTISIAQPVIDGNRSTDAQYVQRWLQNQPTSFGDNRADLCASVGAGVRIALNNVNIAGVSGGTGDVTSGAGVTTGVEIAIPLSQLGNPSGPIRIAGWVNGGNSDYMSNQVIGGLTPGQGNLGGDGAGNYNGNVGSLNFATGAYATGNQFVTVPNTSATNIGSVSIDGSAEAAYGAAIWTNTNGTGFGDSNLGVTGYANGSEIDQVFAKIATASVDGQPAGPYLLIVIAGNLESNFNHLNIFIDTGAADGQNPIEGGPSLPAADGLGNHVGLTLDAGFKASYYISIRQGGSDPDMYADFAKLNSTGTNAGGGGGYLGFSIPPAALVGTGSACPPNDSVAVGSELDGVYSYLDRAARKLYVFASGNMKQNDYLHMFFDLNGNPASDRGQNIIGIDGTDGVSPADNVQIGIPDHLHKFAGVSGDPTQPGLTFENNFYADYWAAGHFENVTRMALDSAVIRTHGLQFYPSSSIPVDFGAYSAADSVAVTNAIIPFDGSAVSGGPTATPPGINLQDGTVANLFSAFGPRKSNQVLNAFLAARGANPFSPPPIATDWTTYISANPVPTGLVQGSYRNNNVVGVTDSSGAGAGAATTGFEFVFDLNELGWTNPLRNDVKLVAFVANSDTTVISNQITGGSGQTANLGNPKALNLQTLPGTQTIRVGFCLADFNQSGTVTTQDLFDFLTAWFAKSAIADVNGNPPGSGSAHVTTQDLFDFLAAWFARPCI